MSITPGKARSTGIPAPGKTSSIPTPGAGRLRSTSNAMQFPSSNPDEEYISRAFADAIRANDPSHHRTGFSFINDAVSLSPQSASYASQSGRRSVTSSAIVRPSSSASSSSTFSIGPQRSASAKVPLPRPASRTSDVFTRSSSRAGRTFEVGDQVRIESLGFEGILRYIGEIDGKPGIWAGVELGAGFVGKGKNDGSVSGKQYFVCPHKCGVFVAIAKLSAATVSYGSISRPSSVASIRNGRATPSTSGRVTPLFSASMSSGRKTPSLPSGRITPNGRVTPAASAGRRTPGTVLPGPRNRTVTMIAKTPTRSSNNAGAGITPGSRASKYVGMTAQQLNNRPGAASPSRNFTNSPARPITSPSQSTFNFPSPSKGTSSPFTAKTGRGIGVGTPTRPRPPNTPRQRVPSSVSMPPPASPSAASLASRSVSHNDPLFKPPTGRGRESVGSMSDLALNGQNIQDRIADLMSAQMSSMDKPSRPASSASVATTAINAVELQNHIDRLQARLDAMENENQRLHAKSNDAVASASRTESLTEDRDKALDRVTELEASLRASERTLSERSSTIESLERNVQQLNIDLEKIKGDSDARVRDIQSKLDDKDTLVTELKTLIETKEGQESENDAVLSAKNAEIAVLEARVQKAYAELEEERKELGDQVDELRRAGQETIALYEERLSAADARRYEMEDMIAALEEQLRNQARPLSPSTVARQANSALEIDNEALREQTQHLNKRITTLEDQLEEVRASAELDEAAVEERVKQFKELEASARLEATEGRKEVERLIKLESDARLRIEEIEEALRESQTALENAQGEIEVLRIEVADSETTAEAVGSPIKQNRSPVSGTGDYELLKESLGTLQRDIKQRDLELAEEREAVAALQLQLEESHAEIEVVRKKLNRDITVDGRRDSKSPSPPSKHIEEIKGLKHIIQELQMENANYKQKYKVLESENKLLLSETEQLREDMKALEEQVEQSLLQDEQTMQEEQNMLMETPEDVSALQKSLRDLKTKYDADLDQQRKRYSEADMKAARTIHDLNKEISELESLIESKIYHEDELEREIERLKGCLSQQQRKTSKGLPEDIDHTIISSSISRHQSTASTASHMSASTSTANEEVCEICERPGHDIFTCDLLKDDRPLSSASSKSLLGKEELVCEDCEEPGHIAANCPHSLDVF